MEIPKSIKIIQFYLNYPTLILSDPLDKITYYFYPNQFYFSLPSSPRSPSPPWPFATKIHFILDLANFSCYSNPDLN